MEVWRDVPNYENYYQVSSLGNIRSLDRIVNHPKSHKLTLKGRNLKPSLTTKKKYYQVILSRDGKLSTFLLHSLVLLTFKGQKTDGDVLVVDHINNNPLDNRIENLQLIPVLQNTLKDVRGVSKYLGVCFEKGRKKWKSQIMRNGKKYSIGYYDTEKEASDAYQLKAKQLKEVVDYLK